MVKKYLPDLVLAAALGISAVVFWYFRLIVPATEIHAGSGDLYTQIYPMAVRATAWMRQGQLPLWNPFQFCGQPFLASVLYGIFYPFNFPYFLFSTAAALEAIAVEHLFLTGLFTYCYARTIRVSRFGAAMAAVVFMFSGFVAAQALWFTPAIGAVAWVPLGFLAIEKLFAAPRFRAAALLAVAVAMPVLAGWLQVWVYTIHALMLYAGGRLLLAWRRDWRTNAVTGVLLALGVVLGLALAAVQLLPSMELQAMGPRRPGGLTIEQTLTLGPIAPRLMLKSAVTSTPGFPRQEYVGMLPLVLVLGSLFATKGRVRVFLLWCLLIFSVTTALTVYTPWFLWYRLVPGAAWFRIPWRIIFIAAFAAAVLTGVGVDALRRMAETQQPRRWSAAVMFLVATALWLGLVDMPARSQLYLAVGLVLIEGMLLIPSATLRRGVQCGLLALLVFDLFAATRSPAKHPFHDLGPLDREHEALDYVKAHQGLYRTYIAWGYPGNPPIMPKQGTLREIYSIADYEPLSMERYAKFYALLDVKPPDESDPAHVPFIGFLSLSPSPAAIQLASLMSLRYVAIFAAPGPLYNALQTDGWRTVLTPTSGHFAVLENPDPLARAYVAYDAVGAREGADALGVVAHPSFDPRRSVVIEGLRDATAIDPATIPASTPADIVSYRPQQAVIELNAPRPGYLVLTDTFYPGWVASTDGQPTDIYRANYLFRAVRVPAGRHTVEFSYRPRSFMMGAAISLCALAILGTGWVRGAVLL